MGSAKISPEKIDLLTVVKQSDPYPVTITVDISEKGAIPRIDVYFLSDTTGSMNPAIDPVKSGASTILRGLRDKAKGVEADLCFGVGDYKDVEHSYIFKTQQVITPTADDVEKAINNLTTSNGNTTAEAQLYALDQIAQPPGGPIGWRNGGKRIVVWFGDAPGHDPICAAISRLGYDITEKTVTDKLKKEEIIVLAISVLTGDSGPGLDVDPPSYSKGGDYESKCHGLGGTRGQASRIAEATGGEFADKIEPAHVVETILRLGGAKVETIGKVSWVADKAIAPFVASSPAEVPVGPNKKAKFDVTFGSVVASTGQGATPVTTGIVDIRADGVSVGQQTVTITAPDLTGQYRIQSENDNKLFLQIKNNWGWVVDVDEEGKVPDARQQQWELTPSGDGNSYLINNLYPRSEGDRGPEEPPGRYLEVADGAPLHDNQGIVTRGGGPKILNHRWRVIPVGTDNNGVIYRIESALSTNISYVVDEQNAKLPDRAVVLFHYWGNYDPSFQPKFGQHWRLLAL